MVQGFFGGPIGWLVLFGLVGTVWYHTLNGIRHLAWDLGYGYGIPDMYRTGWAVLAGTAVMTALTVIVLLVAGLGA